MKWVKPIVIRTFITVASIAVAWAGVHGLALLYVKLFGHFYPNPDQQQHIFDYYFISVLVAMVNFVFLGNYFYNRKRKSNTKNIE